MSTTVKLLLGDAGSGKTDRLLTEYRGALEKQRGLRRPGRALWLAPTHRAAQAVIEKLFDSVQPILFTPQVITFDVFAEQILAAAGRPATPISPVMKRLLLRRIVGDLRQSGKLDSFSSVAQTSGFLDVVSSFISELKQEEIWPAEFLAACADRPPRMAQRDGELGLIYEQYQQHLGRRNWYDNEGRFWHARVALAEGKRGRFADVEFLAVDGFADFTKTQYEILQHLLGWIDQAIISVPHEQPPSSSNTKKVSGTLGMAKVPDTFFVHASSTKKASKVQDTLFVQSPPPRPELFAKPHKTVESLRANVPPGTVCQTEFLVADRANSPAGLRTVAEFLFSNPRSMTEFDDAAGLEVIAATGPEGERQAVARRIKRLLQDGIPPKSIVVAIRSISDSGSVWKEYFDEAGIPTWSEAGTSLNTSPIVKALFSVLQLELENWPFLRLMQVLDSNYFQPDWPEASKGSGQRAVAAALRKLKLETGRDVILRVLARFSASTASPGESASEPAAKEPSIAAIARSAEGLLLRLSKATERLRRRHTLTDWGDVISSLGDELGWRKGIAGTKKVSGTLDGEKVPDTFFVPATLSDSRDWDLLQRIIRTAAEADRCFVPSAESQPAKQPRLNLQEFLAELRDLLRGEQIKPPSDPGGCVRLLDVEQARHLEIHHLFLVGLSESSFPQNRSDDCLFGETERKEFARRGLKLKHREQHQRDEMFLFYSIVTRARTQLTLSYPAVNSSGQPVFPSPYMVALRSLFSTIGLEISREGQLDPVPSHDSVLTESDLRLAAVSEARSGDPGLFARLCERPGWFATGYNILAAVEVNIQRFHERGFTSYEGRLVSDFNVSRLQQRFGTRHQFSATELEAYAICPFRFWLGSVLKVDELATPEQGTDYAARGSLIHDVLAHLLTEGIDRPAEELAARFCELVEERLASRFHETDLQRAMTRIERRLLAEWGTAFGIQQTTYFDRLREAWSGTIDSLSPEIPFGTLPDAPEATDEPANPPLTFGREGEAVQVRGRIDRVDMGSAQGHRVFNVIDYKTGQPPKSSEAELKSGRAIQLALYSLAIQRLGLTGADADPFAIGYWSLRSTGFVRGYQKNTETFVPLKTEQLESLEQILDQVIPQLAAGIRSGKFLVENADDDCTGRCPYHTTCRVNQIRALPAHLNKIGDILDPALR